MRSSIKRSSALLLVALLIPGAAIAKKDNAKAVELSRDAIAKYRAKDYDAAGELFLRSYELSGRPAQLRNAAKAYEEGDRLERALELWKRYRGLEGLTQDERAEADVHVALINEKTKNAAITTELAQKEAEAAKRAQEAAKQPEVVETPVVLAVEPPPPSSPSIGGWVLVGAGAIMAIAGVALWFVAQDQLASLDDRLMTLNADGLITGTTPDRTASDVDRINGERIASGVLLPVGLSAALGGTLWLVFD
jgi:hypothetical protein